MPISLRMIESYTHTLRRIFLSCAIIGMLCILPKLSHAETWQTLLQQMFHHHADLNVAAWQTNYAQNAREQILAAYDVQFKANMGMSHEITSPVSSFSASTTDTMQLFSQSSRLLKNGDQIAINMQLNRRTQDVLFNQIDPAYSAQLNMQYRHPLVRGVNNLALNHQLQASFLDESLIKWQLAMIRHGLAGQLLGFIYQYRQFQIRVQLARAAVKRSQRLLRYQKQRELFGLIEKSERLQTSALLALRQREAVQAIADQGIVVGKINRLLQRDLNHPFTLTWQDIALGSPPTLTQCTQTALQKRPIFQLDRLRLAALDARIEAAQEDDKIQLDVVAEVGTRALSASALHSGLSILNPAKHYVYLGLDFSDSLQHRAAKATLRKLLLQQNEVKLLRKQSIEQLKDTLADILLNIQAGHAIYQAMKKSEQAEKNKFYAESERYRQGRSSTAVLIQFEDTLRQAQLASSLQNMQLQLFYSQLQWLQGQMMETYDMALHDEQP